MNKPKNNKPFFSVVMPVYNKEPHISRSITSVLNQTFEDFELIVVCDPSTDNSNAEVEKFTDARIRVFYRDKPGPGGYAARNLGIKEAKAEWIVFLDADDEWYPEHLEKMMELSLEFKEASVMGCGCHLYDPEKGNTSLETDSFYKKYVKGGARFFSFSQYVENEVKGLRPLNGITACIKKDVLLAVSSFPEGKANRGGDVDTWLRCIEYAQGVAWSNHIGAIYYRDSVNMVTKTQLFLAEVERESIKKLLPKYNGQIASNLKKFANKRTINGWSSNQKAKGIKNFNLFGKLYLSVNPIKNLIFILLSLLPTSFYLFGLNFIKKSKNILKNYLKKLKQSIIGTFIKRSLAVYLRLKKYGLLYHAKNKYNTTVLSHNDNPTFFGYHDKTPFSLDGSKILAMSITSSDIDAKSECTPMKLGYFTKEANKFSDNFIEFGVTTTWCWQQGCMLQWYPKEQNQQVIYNDLVEGKYGSVLHDINSMGIIKKFNYPIYAISSDGKYATTLNFSRLGRLRPGYGYSLIEDITIGISAPENDGLFLMDLDTGIRTLLVSLKELAQNSLAKNVEHYINHATFSPDGKRLVFFHLWAQANNKDRGLRVCEYNFQSSSWKVIEDKRIVSHYAWFEDSTFIATSKEKNGKWHYSLYDLEKATQEDLDISLYSDGHPMYNPLNKKLIVTDSYPDRARDQHLYIVDIESKEILEVAKLYSPDKFTGQVRCDLHPRWDRDGKYICVDSSFKGKRNLVILEVK